MISAAQRSLITRHDVTSEGVWKMRKVLCAGFEMSLQISVWFDYTGWFLDHLSLVQVVQKSTGKYRSIVECGGWQPPPPTGGTKANSSNLVLLCHCISLHCDCSLGKWTGLPQSYHCHKSSTGLNEIFDKAKIIRVYCFITVMLIQTGLFFPKIFFSEEVAHMYCTCIIHVYNIQYLGMFKGYWAKWQRIIINYASLWSCKGCWVTRLCEQTLGLNLVHFH